MVHQRGFFHILHGPSVMLNYYNAAKLAFFFLSCKLFAMFFFIPLYFFFWIKATKHREKWVKCPLLHGVTSMEVDKV